MLKFVGEFHPFLVHFPVALIIVTGVAEVLYVMKRSSWLGDAARFMIIAAAWMVLPTMLSGFAAASGEVFAPEQQQAFAIHRIAGIVVPCLAVLAAGLAIGARQTGQIWELMLYRVFLAAAVAAVIVAGIMGGQLVHGPM